MRTVAARAIDYPSNVRLLTRVVDAQGGDFRYDRTITYRTTFGNGSVVESTVATTDNFIRQLSGRPGTWRITTTPPNGLTFRGIECRSIATGATVTVSPFSDAFGVGGSFPTVSGDNYDCTLDLQVVEPGRLTLVKRTFDGQGVEVFVDEDFQMAINPFVGGFSMDTSTSDADNIPFEQYTRTLVMALPVGTYTFVEGSSPAFALQSITCSGPGSANVTVTGTLRGSPERPFRSPRVTTSSAP